MEKSDHRGISVGKVALGNYCPRCGKDVSGDIVRCSNCGTPIAFNRYRSGILTVSGTLAIVGVCVFLFAGAFSFFFNYIGGFAFILTRDLVWLGILSLLSFMLGLIGGVFIFEVVHLKWIFRILVGAIILPILPVIVDAERFPFGGYPFIVYYVDLTFLIFDLPAICLVTSALALAFAGRKEFVGK